MFLPIELANLGWTVWLSHGRPSHTFCSRTVRGKGAPLFMPLHLHSCVCVILSATMSIAHQCPLRSHHLRLTLWTQHSRPMPQQHPQHQWQKSRLSGCCAPPCGPLADSPSCPLFTESDSASEAFGQAPVQYPTKVACMQLWVKQGYKAKYNAGRKYITMWCKTNPWRQTRGTRRHVADCSK